MELSILNSTKQILGLAADYTPFDLAVITHINATFATLTQLGVGPSDGLFIQDESTKWADLALSAKMLNFVRTYVFLNVRNLFDPPQTSFYLSAAEKQIDEAVWRISVQRDEELAEAAS